MSVTTIDSQNAQAFDLSIPPKPGKASEVVFPTFTIHRLGNGIPVYIVENHAQPYVSLQLVMRSGASHDGTLPGLANFTSNLLLSGAGGYDAQQLAEEIDFLGATLDATSGRDETTVQLGVLTRFLPHALDLMADVALRPTFPADEVARERKQAIAALKQSQSDPGFLAAVQFRRELYGDTPYGSEIDGTEESLKRITRDDCQAYHRLHFTAGNAFFVAAGDVVPESFLAMLEERFGVWIGEAPPALEFPPPVTPESPRVVIVDRPDSVQSAIRLGTTGIARRNADHIPLMTLNTLFGGYFNSRINHNLREQHGYTYGARSVVEAPIRPGAISVAVAVRADVTDAAVGEIFNELGRITTEPVTAEELEMVKNYLIGSQALQIETPGQVASFVRTIALYDLPADYYQTMPAVVRALTQEEILALAQRRLRPETMIVVVVGDASAIREKLERFGPVTVVDVRGEKVV
jgi:zinc protease